MNTKAQAGGLSGMVATLVVVGILIIIGIFVFATVDNSIDQDDLSTDANATIEDVRGNFYDANSLAVVALIVLAASVIIAILLSSFTG